TAYQRLHVSQTHPFAWNRHGFESAKRLENLCEIFGRNAASVITDVESHCAWIAVSRNRDFARAFRLEIVDRVRQDVTHDLLNGSGIGNQFWQRIDGDAHSALPDLVVQAVQTALHQSVHIEWLELEFTPPQT